MLFILCITVSYIHDPDSSPSLSYIWSWFFPVTVIYDPDSSPSCTVLYMILILPRHALSYIWSWFFPSLSYISSWFFPVTVLYIILILPHQSYILSPDSSPSCNCLVYDPDSSPSLSYIWSWFFPVTVLYMILILPHHRLCIWSWFFLVTSLIYDPDSPSSVLYMILVLPCHSLSYISWFFCNVDLKVWFPVKNLWHYYLCLWYLNRGTHFLIYINIIFLVTSLIYDPDSSPSLSYIWSWFFPAIHCLIYPDSSVMSI